MAAEEKSVVPLKRSLVEAMARDYDMEASAFLDAIKNTVFPAKDRNGLPPTQAHLISYLSVCHQYGLNPFIGQVWPFPLKSGGFKPVPSIDGWLHMLVNNPKYDGYEYKEELDNKGKLVWAEIAIFVKDRSRPTIHREWYGEAYRDTDPWKTMPHRMLENRTTIQGTRRAFGIGLPSQDELERAEEINITADSIEMERTTNTKTEALKDKIGAAKGKKAAEPPANTPTPAAAPETASAPAASEAPQAPAPAAPASEVASLFDEPPPLPVDKTPITEMQREALMLQITKRFPPTEPDKKLLPGVKAAIMKKLQAHGINHTKFIIASDYEDFMQWARKFEPEK